MSPYQILCPTPAGAKTTCEELLPIALLAGRERWRVCDYYGSFFFVAFILLTEKISLNITFTIGTVCDSEEVVADKEKEYLIQIVWFYDVFYASNIKSFQTKSKTTFETCHKWM